MDEVTLRDYFAAKAMVVFLEKEELNYEGPSEDLVEQLEFVALDAYRTADAMLVVRAYKNRGKN